MSGGEGFSVFPWQFLAVFLCGVFWVVAELVGWKPLDGPEKLPPQGKREGRPWRWTWGLHIVALGTTIVGSVILWNLLLFSWWLFVDVHWPHRYIPSHWFK